MMPSGSEEKETGKTCLPLIGAGVVDVGAVKEVQVHVSHTLSLGTGEVSVSVSVQAGLKWNNKLNN